MPRKIKTKICGLMNKSDCNILNDFMPDYAGIVFAKTRHEVSEEDAFKLRQELNSRIPIAGVFVDENPDRIYRLIESGTIQLIQLHGSEDEEYISELKNKLEALNKEIPIIKAVRVQSTEQILAAQELSCDMLLLDAYQKDLPGGTGKRFALELIPELYKEYFIAGGIDASNVSEIVESTKCSAVDASSLLETDGHKDREKVKAFMQAMRQYKA